MPSSDPITIPHILTLASLINPSSILDVGCGNGRYGFLLRETLDLNYGFFPKTSWKTQIDAVEIDTDYLSPVHSHVYNNLFIGDWLEIEIPFKYDLVFMGDVLEHFGDGEWQEALSKALRMGRNVIVVCPNWPGSIAQGAWFGHDSECHRVELSPSMVGGRCVFANSKCFVVVFGEIAMCPKDTISHAA